MPPVMASRDKENVLAPADLALVLAVDVSASVNHDEFRFMIDGLVRAWRHSALHAAIAALPAGGLGVTAMFWSEAQQVAVPWTMVRGPGEAENFAASLEDAPRVPAAGATALGEGLVAALHLLATCPFAASRAVIDVSGDGSSNRGRPPGPMRDLAVASGVTVNGLAVVNEEPDLVAYFHAHVIGGPSSFVLDCHDYVGFEDAILQKLLREIPQPSSGVASSVPASVAADAYQALCS